MEAKEIEKKIKFLESVAFFRSINRRALNEYIYYFSIVNFQWKDVVFG